MYDNRENEKFQCLQNQIRKTPFISIYRYIGYFKLCKMNWITILSSFMNLIRFILSCLKINVTYGMILMIDQFWCMFLNSLIRKTKQFWWSWPLLSFLFKAWKMWWTFILGKFMCLFVFLKCVTLYVLKKFTFYIWMHEFVTLKIRYIEFIFNFVWVVDK